MLTGLAMGRSAKCSGGSGAEHLTIVRFQFNSASRWQEEGGGTGAETDTFLDVFIYVKWCFSLACERATAPILLAPKA